ncbi:MAG: PEP-CTERM sorting domain-containing protein [Pseudomonadota bacterium]
MKTLILTAASVAAAFGLTAANASTVLTDTQFFSVTTGQDFTFEFLNPDANAGGTGTLVLDLKGDYIPISLNLPGFEFVTLTFDGVMGAAVIENGSVTSNTIVGLTLDNITEDTAFNDDEQFQATFIMSEALLNMALSGGVLRAVLDNSSGVNLVDGNDFNSFSLTYNASQVPVPGALPLMAAGLGAIATRRRKSKA